MFELIDQDSDGLISKQDLAATFKSIGEIDKSKDDKLQEKMLKESKTDLNFASFLSLMVNKNTLSSSENLKKTFALFNINSDSSKEIEIDTRELTRNLTESNCDIDEEEINKAMTGYITEDSITNDKIFLGGRFIHSVGI